MSLNMVIKTLYAKWKGTSPAVQPLLHICEPLNLREASGKVGSRHGKNSFYDQVVKNSTLATHILHDTTTIIKSFYTRWS